MRNPAHAPAVRYAYGPSRALGLILATLASCGLVLLLAWLVLGTGRDDVAFKAGVGLIVWLLCAGFAWHGWRHLPRGFLVWDGGQWRIEGVAQEDVQVLQRGPCVHLDLQAVMLLSLRPSRGRGAWIWLERRSDAMQWLALRRAIYSPAQTEVGGATATMSATSSRQDDGANHIP